MSLTYQQQFVLDGLAARAAILNLDARHNRLYSEGDLFGWITTFRHAGATYVRAGETSRICEGVRRRGRCATGDR